MAGNHHIGRLIASLLTCLVPGYFALYCFTTSIPGWYSTLNKPDFVPPDIIIFYAIIAVFCLLGLALYTVWTAGPSDHEIQTAMQFLIFTLVLLMVWFIVFFPFEAVFLGLVVMVMAVAALLCTLMQSLRCTVSSTFFLVPCLILLLIFCIANFQIYLMNPGIPVWGELL